MIVFCVSGKDFKGLRHVGGDILALMRRTTLVHYFRREKLPSAADQIIRHDIAYDILVGLSAI